MALPDYARNLFGSKQLGDLSLVSVVVAADGTRDSTLSAPETTVTAAGSGVYDITFPKATKGFVLAANLVTTNSDGVFVEIKAFDADAGTCQLELSDEANLSSSETIHLHLLLAYN
jgi:hypothetical protein